MNPIRSILSVILLIALTGDIGAEEKAKEIRKPASTQSTSAPAVPYVNIWPDKAVPHGQGDGPLDTPAVQVYLPEKGKATGSAVVVYPGGGYGVLAKHEGAPIARWLNQNGIAAFVVRYRLGPKYHYPAEIEDGQRAVQFVRANAEKYGVKQDKIGIIGFSAGGHLASSVATHVLPGDAKSEDPVAKVSSAPNAHILIYPVIDMAGPNTHVGSRNNLFGSEPAPELWEMFSNHKQITKETSPGFLVHSTTDKVVPVANADDYVESLKKAGVKVKYIRLDAGAHGYGLTDKWSGECVEWLRGLGF